MDFFAEQQRARRRTSELVLAFIIAVVGILAATNLAISLLVGLQTQRMKPDAQFNLHVVVSLTTLAMVVFGTWAKIAELGAGGRIIAERLGGRRIDDGGATDHERRFVNVVEEMAIASGVPVPSAYVLDDEHEINAFAAGAHDDAVVAVTRGAMERLDRDELQGVVAHEFSHILNGDSRLNVRMIGVLHGILMIGLFGHTLLRLSAGGSGRSRRSDGAVWFALLGLALILIGSFGTFCGRLIQAAVSRSCELLADASAVQFTRNPHGLAGALKRVFAGGGAVRAPRAGEASHLFFAEAIGDPLSKLLATHPSLATRIRALEPTWNGIAECAPERTDISAAPERTVADVTSEPSMPPPSIRAGTIADRAIVASRAVLTAMPASVRDAARSPGAASGVILALLLDDHDDIAARQVEIIARRDVALGDLTRRLYPQIAPLAAGSRMPLIDLCAPALRRQSADTRADLVALIRELTDYDGRTTIDEWLLAHLVMSRLDEHVDHPDSPPAAPSSADEATVIAAMAYAGAADAAAARVAFSAAAAVCGLGCEQPSPDRCGTAALSAALTRLAQASPQRKRAVVDACAAAIAADGMRSAREDELLRVVCGCIGVPLPL